MKYRISTEQGDVIVDSDVIATYAGTVAMECYGIVGMSSINMKDGLSKLLKKAAIRGVRFHVTAENLWTLDYYKISDPENTNRSYPLQTTITGGINLSF